MSQYQTGTVAVTNGSAAIVGTGTAWTSALEGGVFKVTGVAADYTVTTVTDTTHITLSAAYTGANNTTATYQITQDFTDNYSFREINAGDREWAWHLTQTLRLIDNSLSTTIGSINGALTDGNYSAAELITGINGGETIDQWDLVYYDATETEWMIADADVSGKGPAWGIAVAATSNGSAASILTKGFVNYSTWDWTPGAILYLSDTPGGLTETAPSSSGAVVQPVGKAVTADIVYFNFNPIAGFGVI